MSTATHTGNNPPEPSVEVVGNSVIINNLVSTDPVVVRGVTESENPVAYTLDRLSLGFQAGLLSTASAGTAVLTSAVEHLTGSIETSTDSAVKGISDAVQAALSPEDGALPKALADIGEKVSSALAGVVDPDSKSSIVNQVVDQVEDFVKHLAEDQGAKLGALLDTRSPTSPLTQWKDDVVRTLKTETGEIRKEVVTLGERIAASAAATTAEKIMFAKTTLKGTKFEDLVFGLTAPIAQVHADLAEHTGHETGLLGTKDGDIVITLDEKDTGGAQASFVLEAKDKPMSKRAILNEVKNAMANRGAAFGVAIFSGYEIAPITTPFEWHGDKAIAVIDKDNPENGSLLVVYAWARLMTRYATMGTGTDVDLGRVQALVGDVQRALQAETQIKRNLSVARKGIEEAGTCTSVMTREIVTALESISTEIGKGNSAAA